MNDADLLAFGCAVSFIVAAGTYVYLRERFMEAARVERREAEKARAAKPRLRKVA